jgi:hypothetical protein
VKILPGRWKIGGIKCQKWQYASKCPRYRLILPAEVYPAARALRERIDLVYVSGPFKEAKTMAG